MATEENNNQEEVLEESEQEELVEAPEQDENQPEVELSEKSKVKEDDDEDDDDDDEEEEEDEQVKKEEVKIPSTKAQMIKTLFDKINGIKKEEVSTKWKDLMGKGYSCCRPHRHRDGTVSFYTTDTEGNQLEFICYGQIEMSK